MKFDSGRNAFLFLFLLVTYGTIVFSAENVKVSLQAKFNSAPLILQASEFFSDFSDDVYWSFIDRVADQSVEGLSPEKQFEWLLESAEDLLGPASRISLEYSLKISHYVPKIVMYQHLLQEALISSSQSSEVECSVWVHSGRTQNLQCWSGSLEQSLKTSGESSNNEQLPEIFKFDHVYPSSSSDSKDILIVYGELDSRAFSRAHKYLLEAMKSGDIRVILRPKVSQAFSDSSSPLQLQGYGVELAIKDTEYKLHDDSDDHKPASDNDDDAPGSDDDELLDDDEWIDGFQFATLIRRWPQSEEDLLLFREELLSRREEHKKVQIWDMDNLGFQASQRILQSEHPFRMLQETSQNFPSYGHAITKIHLRKDVRSKIEELQHFVQAGSNFVSINGLEIKTSPLDIFEIQKIIRTEAFFMSELSKLGLSNDEVSQVLSIDFPKLDDKEFGLDMRPVRDSVMWLNDLESDDAYKRWDRSVNGLLRAMWPGQLASIAKNLYEIVIAVDIASSHGLELASYAYQFISQMNAPIRLGFIFTVPDSPGWNDKEFPEGYWDSVKQNLYSANEPKDSELSSIVAKLVLFLRSEHSVKEAMKLVECLKTASHSEDLVDSSVKSCYESSAKGQSYEDVMTDEKVVTTWKNMHSVAHYRGIMHTTQSDGVMIFNGRLARVSLDDLRDHLSQRLMTTQQNFARMVYMGELNDKTNLPDLLYNHDDLLQAYSDLTLSEATSYANSFGSLAPLSETVTFHSRHACKDITATVTVWAVVNAQSRGGLSLVKGLSDFVSGTQKSIKKCVRVALIHNPEQVDGVESRAARAIAVSHRAPDLLARLATLLRPLLTEQTEATEEVLRIFSEKDEMFSSLSEKEKKSIFDSSTPEFDDLAASLGTHRQFVSSRLGLDAGQNAWVVNGKIFPVDEKAARTDLDIKVLAAMEYKFHSKKIGSLLKSNKLDAPSTSDLVAETSFLLAKRSQGTETGRQQFPVPDDFPVTDCAIVHESDSPFSVRAVLDPLSETAQVVSQLLIGLKDAFDFSLLIFLNPQVSLTKMPIKRYYRFVFDPKMKFDDETGEIEDNPVALFRTVPRKQLLTMGVETPESWHIQSVYAVHDLDNIRMVELPAGLSTLRVKYQLEHLLVYGHCFESTLRGLNPASGLQVILGTPSTPHLQDTIVMQNLGYFQLKAEPGVWTLDIAEGDHRKVFQIDAGTSDDVSQSAGENRSHVKVAAASFSESARRLNVFRRKGMEQIDLMSTNIKHEIEATKSTWSNWFGSTPVADIEDDNTIHIMSVASGHLYERFLKIMMLSVIKNTQSPVKFWFFEQFLSPQFKQFLPAFAKEYNFEVDLISYKWPSWLHKESQKQRTIWGYKILFLDVLFPLKLKRIIFVDADQIVRADLKELWDMDLKGAPYAYTPFCDSNKATKGFRFWDSGYWKTHLQGRPYHISALYVVDMELFRRIRAGDKLRVKYDMLSRDENSLSNLDQDLPNYAQHEVPIFSLPQDWLWCETWCSMGSLKTAKTIDLCNNPQTKEPKLDKAKRLVPEWVDLDNEAREATDRILGLKTKKPHTKPESTSEKDGDREEL
eukprot:156778_1